MSASDTIVHGPADVSRSALLQVRSLGKRYGDQHALFDISFEARACEVIGLIGPNGAGKTTLLESLAGVLPADQGEVLWQGTPLPLHRRREVMFYLPDGLRPWDDQYVARVLQFFAGVYRRLARHVRDVVHAVGLEPVTPESRRLQPPGRSARMPRRVAVRVRCGAPRAGGPGP